MIVIDAQNLSASRPNRPLFANLSLTAPIRDRKNASMTVAKTSKNPSTQRWTTHQRQYSAEDTWVPRPYMSAGR